MKKYIVLCAAVLCLSIAFGGAASAQHVAKRFQLRTVDDDFAGVWAYRLLLPEGWNIDADVEWTTGINLVETRVAISSADGNTVLRLIPGTGYKWPPGQWDAYSPAQNRQYLDPITLLREDFVSDFTQRPGFRIVDERQLPEEAREIHQSTLRLMSVDPVFAEVMQGQVPAYQAGQVDFSVQEQGQVFFLRFKTCTYALQGPGEVYWGPSAVILFVMPLSQKDRDLTDLGIIASSWTANPLWEHKQYEVQLQKIRESNMQSARIQDLTRYIANTQNQISDILADAYRGRSEANSRLSQSWSEATMGVNTYYDGTSETNVVVPAQYEHVWTNGSEYVITEDPNFQPGNLPGNWRKLPRNQ